ncbi:MAG: pyridoxal phosphate-dependent aminotransferase [Intestinimonas sp.]|jgi:cystathionine beta-lyase|nr:pyridoxal phosphate-dependent aminotransferase [Intestinimonas sp.]
MDQFNEMIDRTGTGSIKWDRCKAKFETTKDLIPLWIADTDFRAPEAVIQAIHNRANHGVFGYTFAMEDYRNTVSRWFQRRHGLNIPPEWITATQSVVTALRFAIEALTKPEEKVLILTPAYEPFFAIVKNTGRILVEQELKRNGDFCSIDFDQMEEAFRQGVKMMIFCNPHNPVGRVWNREELERVSKLCAKYGVYLASDEVHGDITLFGTHYTSMVGIEAAKNLTMSFTSAGKPFSLTGLCSANLIIPDGTLRDRIVDKIHDAWIMSPNLFGLVATKAAYEHGESWLDAELRYLEENSKYVQQFLAENLSKISLTKHEGTYMMWLDFHEFDFSTEELERRIVDVCGLGLGFGRHYGEKFGQYMRLNIGCARPLLQRAMRALCKITD